MNVVGEREAAALAVAEKVARARVHFRDYVEFVHDWTPPPHQEEWFELLEALYYGELVDEEGQPCHKGLFQSFPGSGKSDTLIEWMAWVIGMEVAAGRDPHGGIVSYADDVAAIRSAAVKDTIEFSTKYHAVFPQVKPARGKGWGQAHWYVARRDVTKKDPTLVAVGLSGAVLSHRLPTFIVIDDPHDKKTLTTAHQRDTVWSTYWDEVRTRALEDSTPIVGIGTRWVEDDLWGRIIANEKGWRILRTPAMGEDGETVCPPSVDRAGNGYGISTRALENIRAVSYNTFQTQYQALPPSASGNIFRHFSFAPRPGPGGVRRVFQVWDTAFTNKTSSSFNVMGEFWDLTDGTIYINWVYRAKLTFHECLEKVEELYKQGREAWGDRLKVLMEYKASGPAIVDMLRQYVPIIKRNIPNRTLAARVGDIEQRANAVSHWFEAERIVLPQEFSVWRDEYIAELRSFTGRGQGYDDQVAVTVLLLEYLLGTRTWVPDVELRIRGW